MASVITNHYPSEDQVLPTRRSLLSRLKDWDDQESWYDFFEKYWRFIYAVAIRSGLNDSDAQDVVSKTIIAVSRQMPNFKYDPAKGTFKGFLSKTARFCILDQQRENRQAAKRRADLQPGTSGIDPIENMIDPATLNPPNWDEEWEWNLLQVAIQNVKARIKPKHFQIYDWYVLKDMPSTEVATKLGITVGQVFLVKYRLTELLSKEIQKLKHQYDPPTGFPGKAAAPVPT
jgi:RNA polymerase sigma factor (sigma-70 family)